MGRRSAGRRGGPRLGDVDLDATLYDLVADRRPQWTRGQVQGHLGRFDFSGDAVQRRAGSLSGGERARVALALMMLRGANLLVFDEPTNHLDVESIEALEDALDNFEGTVLLVSHDRALLESLTTRIWSLDGGVLTDFPGGFVEWEEDVERRAQAARAAARTAASPKRPAPRAENSPKPRVSRATDPAALEADVTAREAELAAIEARLADPALYAADGGRDEAAALAVRRVAARAALDRALAAWSDAVEAGN